MRTLFRKWWVILVQGIFLIGLSMYVFSHPGIALASLALWLSILIIISGLAGLFGWWFTSADARETTSMLWSIGCIVLGLVLLTKGEFTMQLLATLVGLWMVVTGGWLLQQGWTQRSITPVAWVIIVPGLFSIIIGVMSIYN